MTTVRRGQRALVDALSGRTRVLDRTQLNALASPGALDRAVARGAIARAAPGLYVLASRRNDLHTRVAVACAWTGPVGTAGGLAALEYDRQTRREVGDILMLVPPSFKRACPPGIRTMRTTAHFRRFVTPDARLALPEDAAVQAWCSTSSDQREGLILDLLRDRVVGARHLLASARRWPRVAAREDLVELARLFTDGVESFLEHRARTGVFVGSEWDHFERQVTLRPQGERVDADMLSREAMLAVELDGTRYHSGDRKRRSDLRRDALLATLGYATIRLTFEDIIRRPAWCRATVRAAVRARRARHGRERDGS